MNEPKQITLEKLFLPKSINHIADGTWLEPEPCLLCGAGIIVPSQHLEFHNGLLGLAFIAATQTKLTQEQLNRMFPQ